MPTAPARRCPNLGCPNTTPCADHSAPKTGWKHEGKPLYKGKEWQRLRWAVMSRDGHTCQACGKPATHVDHVVPLSLGGSHTVENCQALCTNCHQYKTAQEAAQARYNKALRARPR